MKALLVLVAAGAALAQQPQDPRWERLRGLIGRWEGTAEGKSGTGRTVREYRLELDGRAIAGTNTVVYPKEKHEDRSWFTYDRNRKEIALRQFHGEGFVNEYRTGGTAAGEAIQFTSYAIDNIGEGWRARETYTFRGPDEVVEVFELAAPGKEFETYSRTTLRRAGGGGVSPEILPLSDFIEQWKISKQFTLAVAEKMPAEHYEFKPTPEQFTFAEQLAHLAIASMYRFAQLTGDKPKYTGRPPDLSKPAVIALLNESFDYVLAKLPAITPEQMTGRTFEVKWEGRPVANGRDMMLNMFVHVAHHRAQAEVYLRLKGVQPPTYTF
jgi:uncharacterized damage-inducible protein DinB